MVYILQLNPPLYSTHWINTIFIHEADHGPSQSGPYSRVRNLLATFTLEFPLIAKKRPFISYKQEVLLLRQ